ncbi:hypothetical protein [Paracraurococcus ruber]|uniref:Uncharacterized protein n=1 Tax=Paracraurococcus ruber TaxID=77675 RepID=A0ABS1CYT9_9PROT|nr:hypothetical protein [Paracraurococcus ruber]MBK1659495.1 hypothetical protein [Paracraurococcus ruber]TDG27190.1 hypothetical protein E2C05_23765 [Paracraurococcus ruber]
MATHGLPAWPWAGTPVDDLPAAERLLLDGARLWAAAARQGHAPLPALRLPFAAEGATAAVAPLDALLHALDAALPIGCPLCPRTLPAEALLLLGCGLVQRGAAREAQAVLLRCLPAAPVAALLAGAVPLGIALAQAGLWLRNPLRCARA